MRSYNSMAFVAGAMVLAAGALKAQTPSEAYAHNAAQVQAEVRGLYNEKLTPEKILFRTQMVELRDSLTQIAALTARMQRAHATGSSAVVLSGGHWLQRFCRSGSAMADLTTKRMAAWDTHDAQGDKALAAFRNAVTMLSGQLVECRRTDSVLVAQREPDQLKIIAVGSTAGDAVVRFEQARDVFLKMLGVSMPVAGTR